MREEILMMTSNPERQAQLVRLVLMIVGVILLAVGWYRWAQ